MAESLLPSRERVAAGVNGGECIVDAAGDLRDEAGMAFSCDLCCAFGSFEETCRAPGQDQPS